MNITDARLFLTGRAKSALAFFGLRYMPVPRATWGLSPWLDVQRAVRIAARHEGRPVPVETIFDVGANDGQTAAALTRIFPAATVWSFEPAAGPYARLAEVARMIPRVNPIPLALGARSERRTFYEYAHSPVSSFQPWTPCASAETAVARTEKEIVPLDDFCRDRDIHQIDLLKVDTEGFELEVLHGAARTLDEGRVRFVYFEFFGTTDGPKGGSLEGLHGPATFLAERGFRPLSFYTEFVDVPGSAGGYNLLMMRSRSPRGGSP